jgi:hypothetical protein
LTVAPSSAPLDVIERGGGALMLIVYWGERTLIGGFPLSATCTLNVLDVFEPVGLPLIVPDWLIVNPAGRLPVAIVSVNGDTPPVTGTANEYGTPLAPFGGRVVPKLGAMTTSIVTVAVAFLSANDTACKETVRVAEMPLGAVY